MNKDISIKAEQKEVPVAILSILRRVFKTKTLFKMNIY